MNILTLAFGHLVAAVFATLAMPIHAQVQPCIFLNPAGGMRDLELSFRTKWGREVKGSNFVIRSFDAATSKLTLDESGKFKDLDLGSWKHLKLDLIRESSNSIVAQRAMPSAQAVSDVTNLSTPLSQVRIQNGLLFYEGCQEPSEEHKKQIIFIGTLDFDTDSGYVLINGKFTRYFFPERSLTDNPGSRK